MSNLRKLSKKRLILLIISIILALLIIVSAGAVYFIKLIFEQNFGRADISMPAYSYEQTIGYSRSTVSFKSGENNLIGYIYGEENDKALVVIAHGIGSNADQYINTAIYLSGKGFRVLTYNATGSYESEGDGTIGLAQSQKDLDAALTYVESEDSLNTLPILLYGHSWGGYAVTAVLNKEHDVKGVVSLSGYENPFEMLVEEGKRQVGDMVDIVRPYLWIYNTMLFGSDANLSAVMGINKSDIPVLIVHGTNDEVVGYDTASIISKKDKITNPSVEYLVFDDPKHSGHNNIVSSGDKSNEAQKFSNEYLLLYNDYDGEIPQEMLEEWKDSYYDAVENKFNPEYIDYVIDFFERALKK